MVSATEFPCCLESCDTDFSTMVTGKMTGGHVELPFSDWWIMSRRDEEGVTKNSKLNCITCSSWDSCSMDVGKFTTTCGMPATMGFYL